MSFHFSSTVSKVTCIDLLNNSLEDVLNYCSQNNISDTTKMWLEHTRQNLHSNFDSKEYPHKFYFETMFHIGGIRYSEGIDAFDMNGISKLGSEEILFLPDEDITPADLDTNVFSKMESQIVNNEYLSLNDSLQSLFEESLGEILDTKFDNRFIDTYIQVSNELNVTPKVLSVKYQTEVLFLEDQNLDTSHFKLWKIYYKNLLPIFFVFKNQNNESFLAWNKEYLVALYNVQPANLK